ncbi:hypothetical protein [Paenibacillus silvae]|uniref:Uncharacterized protein n=1 Tax=Paenibacillus silvae TaxID=1325358 RepID=A0A2W6NNQ5_9BACL|nr:hypothetical protein [Paenibacillus silvae]PZT57461.1 hypothetical protein DN757_02050 [Paenibacillus silvae]
MTIKLCELNEGATILNSNIDAILKTHERINEFYLCLDENMTDTYIHRKLYQIRKTNQSNSIEIAPTYQDFKENPVETLKEIFNEAITGYHIEQMEIYNVTFERIYDIWIKDKTIRFGRVLGMLADV